AVPPPSDENFLYDYAASPQIAIRELRELGYLPQGGGLALAIPDALIETSDSGFSSLPLQVGAGFENFALGFRASLRGDAAGAGAACGLIFRQRSRADFSSVLLADEGNAYLLDYSGGALNEGGLAMATSYIDPSPNAENHVLLIVQGEE